MKSGIQLLKSGLSIIDNNWGGVYKTGSYLIIGPKKSGKTIISLQLAKYYLSNNYSCIYFTSLRTKDLMITASTINLDLQYYVSQNKIIVIKATPPNDIFEKENPDQELSDYFKDIYQLVQQYSPDILIFDELTPFVGFLNLSNLEQSYVDLIEGLEGIGTTNFFVVGEPATQYAKDIVNTLYNSSTAKIVLQKPMETISANLNGKISIIPNIGHSEGLFEAYYKIIPEKGFNFIEDLDSRQDSRDITPNNRIEPQYDKEFERRNIEVSISKSNLKIENELKLQQSKSEQRFSKFISLSNFEIKQDEYIHSNVYNFEDFFLFVSNQLSLYKNTGQSFDIYAFKLDSFAIEGKLMSIKQLANTIRLSVDKKDKITIHNDLVILIIVKSLPDSFHRLLANMISNFPVQDENLIKNILRYISVLKVDNVLSYNTANEIFKYIFE
ncbi:MAG TPA: ATPase domain-containing protein [Ignavibacteriales bacterium]|nr:ATPase domain-containing protein [Ignavibacteriales bacterium]HOL81303.1 ATPase domain-containing protein [Ignavibacteriales bacterium]HOM66041.1 ATPase domain-containing protein [Ignavibacteriales bacterium]HPD67533.1 ATPase domain-containing protein [Ignavibacteriales bacterium]HPP33413.1 ATPase domain-containing protein [Ignavibacteriales bacterium]